MTADIVVLPGDGIGPEVTTEAVRTLEAVARKGGHYGADTTCALAFAHVDEVIDYIRTHPSEPLPA